ncbi:DUF1761 domain-containing protein [Candidatus Woesearchaeota archaeon]|nr:DUF1761 domain-containing protein [Candidatus Woesearchaeota archaeon]
MVNILAVLVSTVVGMALGMFWYGPLFGKLWIKIMRFSKVDLAKAQKKVKAVTYFLSFLSTFIFAVVLAYFIEFTGMASAFGGAVIGFLAWLGFLATTLINSVLWENKPWSLYLLNAGHYLFVLVVLGAILGAWN